MQHIASSKESGSHRPLPNMPLQPPHSAVTRLAWASRAPAGGRLNGGVRRLSASAEWPGVRISRLLPVIAVLGALGCTQNMKAIIVPAPGSPTPAQACGVARDTVVSRTQALCIAKVAGLEQGLARWRVVTWGENVSVQNTTHKQPNTRGRVVRIARIGGAIVEITEYEMVYVD